MNESEGRTTRNLQNLRQNNAADHPGLIRGLNPHHLLRWLSHYPSLKAAMSANSRVLRGRPVPVLLGQNYRQHRVPTLHALESDVVSVGVTESPLPGLVKQLEVRDSCHIPSL